MIEHSYTNSTLVLKVRVVPGSARTEVVGEFDRSLRVKIASPPVDGAANDELIRLLAKTFKVSRGAVTILRGPGSRTKQVRVDGPDFSVMKNLGILHKRE